MVDETVVSASKMTPTDDYLMSDVMRAELIDGDISTESRA